MTMRFPNLISLHTHLAVSAIIHHASGFSFITLQPLSLTIISPVSTSTAELSSPTDLSAFAASYRSTALRANIYDDWSLDLLSSSQSSFTFDDLQLPYCDEDAIEQCLNEFMDSDYGKTMFGRHDLAASVGITGSIELVSLEGPECVLSLRGKFWHKRETVLGKAAMYLHARLPELTTITVESAEDLEDFQNVVDEFTGEVLYVEDKRSPDFNGDRETMEYQGLDPDVRGPFVFGNKGPLIRPA